ncbi:receptor-type tyrosine-protein phosphatase kappa-like isoform X1 [Haliotis rubra]|uniref:receptor-type tyrosine-protein phosphatase kappa-like isoform X1 n=1 Tax=Haliotis rubra TaxID=36100 RepID=UPI001EE53AD3|nr:receptor-type tyrosine-protein phosphatase kappa-like isoform X1 [Haliotis rubra]
MLTRIKESNMGWFWIALSIACVSVTLTDAECHCNTTTACTVFPSTPCSQVGDPDRCQEGWFGSYCQKQNIALRRSSSQSSTMNNDPNTFRAGLGVDGRATTDATSLPWTCAHTANQTNPTWTVNLTTSVPEKIQHIRLYIRDNFQERSNGMEIFVGSQMCYNWSSTEHPPPIANVTCRQPLTGTNVTIRIPGQQKFLTLCEVQIFVCSDGWFSEDCDKQCRCANRTDVCDKITGHCSSGCFPGYNGTDCQTACLDGSYGVNCSGQCGNCLHGVICNKTTGTCPGGCVAGWMNDTCHQACPDGSYHVNCSGQCGNCLNGVTCNKTTGTCDDGCAAGWMNDTCHEACPNGSYGINCTNQCGNCSDGVICNKTTGTCPEGCAAGLTTNTCHEACPDGFYGINCTNECGNCLSGVSCDKKSGACPGGCASGWMDGDTMLCLQPCSNGTHGEDCSLQCGQCQAGDVCHKITGACPRGCVEGWTGDTCIDASADKGTTAAIIGGSVAALLVIVVIVAIVICKKRRERKHDDSREHVPSEGLPNAASKDKPSTSNSTHGPPAMEEDEDAVLSVETEVDGGNDAAATYYNWVPPNMRLDNLKQCIIEKMAKASFGTEFEMIPYGARHPHEAAIKPNNKPKNRFLALYAYDDSRVVLADGEDYINANYIMGYDDTAKYIATQGPRPTTITDFWRMVWQEDVTQIVMLTKLMEVNKKKCERYWPDESKSETYGCYKVTNKTVTSRADYTVTTFVVQNNGTVKTVTHYHFTSWPDHGVPSAPALVNFWRLVKHGDMDRGPMVVHCSAGVGRTGAFIALDYLMDEAESKHSVNVFMCVSKMRQNRMNMVQTLSQYVFVHDVVLEALISQGTLYTSSEFDKTFGVGETFSTAQEDMLREQFRMLQEQISELKEDLTSEALLPENSIKNRSQYVLPGNRSRPYLCTPVPGRNDYINAVFLSSTLRPSSMIVTQTPLPDTVVDFWRLVYDHDCFTVVCLDASKETRKMYPKDSKMLQTGPFSVAHMETNSKGAFYTEKKMKLENVKEDSERSVTVFCLRSLDMVSNGASLLEIINVVDRINSSGDHKILVHCIDAAGVSGVFCSALNIISRLRLDRDVDIFLTIRELQRVRPQFIHSFDQYKLCYKMVKEYNRASNVYANLI